MKRRKKYDELIAEFIHDRDTAIASFDIDAFKAYCHKWFPKTDGRMPSDKVIEIAMRKMACEITSLPFELRQKAADWLMDRGYSAGINSDAFAAGWEEAEKAEAER